jgi:hypothetical protein
MNITGKRTTVESKKTQEMINTKIMNGVDISPQIAGIMYSLTLKPSILEQYVEPTLFVLVIGLMGFALYLIILQLIGFFI